MFMRGNRISSFFSATVTIFEKQASAIKQKLKKTLPSALEMITERIKNSEINLKNSYHLEKNLVINFHCIFVSDLLIY